MRLLREEGFDVVAEVGDRDALLAAARQHRPKLVVTDVRMPPTQTDEGLTAAAVLREEDPDVAVLVLSQHVEPKAAALLLSHSPTAVGYLLKERVSQLDEFVNACRTVADGGVVIDPLVTEQLVRGGHDDEVIARLTDREREVLDYMAQGRSNAAIAEEIHCSDQDPRDAHPLDLHQARPPRGPGGPSTRRGRRSLAPHAPVDTVRRVSRLASRVRCRGGGRSRAARVRRGRLGR